MTKNESYSGIDYFRFIAALLIVAIYTSPVLTIRDISTKHKKDWGKKYSVSCVIC